MNLPSLAAFLPAVTLQFLGEIAPRHNRTQRGQHRISLPEGCTEYYLTAGGAQKPSQPPTQGFAVLDCGVQCRRAVIGREGFSKNLLLTFKFPESFGCF